MPEIDVLEALAQDGYRFGNCSILPYRPDQPDVFGRHLIPRLYDMCVDSRILKPLFCGMINLNEDAICSYLATRPIIPMFVYEPDAEISYDQIPDGRTIAGFAFMTAFAGPPVSDSGPQIIGPRSGLAGYGFFRPFWGSNEIKVCIMLVLAYLFNRYRLVTLHGQTYSDNPLSLRFMEQFGFKRTGLLEKFLARRKADGGIELVDCQLTSLSREDLVAYVEKQFLSLVK